MKDRIESSEQSVIKGLIRRTTGLESANLRKKNTERRSKTRKDIRAIKTESKEPL